MTNADKERLENFQEFVQLESINLLKLQLKFQYNVALIIIINMLNKK